MVRLGKQRQGILQQAQTGQSPIATAVRRIIVDREPSSRLPNDRCLVRPINLASTLSLGYAGLRELAHRYLDDFHLADRD